MDRRSLIAGLGALAAAPQIAFAQPASPGVVAGIWSTSVYGEDAVRPERLRFEFRGDKTGQCTLVDRPSRRTMPLALRITGSRAQFGFDIPDIKATFRGKVVSSDRIEGEFDFPAEGGVRPVFLIRGEPLAASPPPMTAGRLEQLRRDHGLAGLAVAVARTGRQALTWTAGERRRGSRDRITGDDLWQLASVTKGFTATMIGRLVDRGVLRWEDTIGGTLGEAAPGMLAAYRPVTLLHLLSHRAGVIRDVSQGLARSFTFDLRKAPADRITAARYVLSRPPAGPAGASAYLYSNAGYQIAAAIAEVRTGRAYEDLMRTELFEPLALRSAVFRESETAIFRKGGSPQPVGHPDSGHELMQSLGLASPPYGACTHPSGGLAMSLPDLLTYLAAHRDETGYLRPETWRTLHTDPFGKTYALGWHLEDADQGGLIHGGIVPGWTAKAAFNRTTGAVGAAVTNDRHRYGEALLAQCIHEGLTALDA